MTGSGMVGTAAVVTGAGGELGSAISRRLLHLGVQVVAADRDMEALDALAVQLVDCPTVHFVCADVSSREGIQAVEEKLAALGLRLSVWVNNAGIVRRQSAAELPLDVWQDVLAANLTSALVGSQAAFRHMKSHGQGSIVNLSSVMGHRTKEGRAAYGTSKAGVEHLTRYLALEFGPHGIRVNSVAPGIVESSMSAWASDGAARDEVLSQIPLRRLATREEIADAVELLATDRTSYVTGHILHVDGGLSC